jgi:hypothetical protein
LRRLLDREGLGVEVLKLDEPFMKAAPRRRVSVRYSVAKAGVSNSTMPVFSIQTSITWQSVAAQKSGLLATGM